MLVPVSDGNLEIGNFYRVKVTDTDDFDLYAVRVNNEENHE